MTFIEQKAKKKKSEIVESKALEIFAFGFMFLVFTTSLTVLIFTAGCPQTMHRPVEPSKPEPNEVMPNEIEPNEVEPKQVEPNEVEPKQVEPNETEPNEVEPNEVESAPEVSFHDKCAGILSKFVDDNGMADYRTLKLKRQELKALLTEFEKLDPNEYKRWPKEDKIAFWLNAYNIQMLNIIVQNYPIKLSRWDLLRFWWPATSIRYIDKKIGGISRQKFYIMNEEFTLSGVERRFFRKEFDEPRVFFAISHASLSSPPLRNEPYDGQKLHEQLEDQVKKFLSSTLAFRIDREDKRVYLSAILQPSWYGKEFINKYSTNKKFKDQQPATRAVLNFLTNYISEQDISFLELEYYSIKYINYDWRLNDSSAKHN